MLKLKKSIIYIVAICATTLSSCSGFLDTSPNDSVKDTEAFTSLDDVNYVNNGVYAYLMNIGYASCRNLMVPDVMSDNLVLNLDGRLTWDEFFSFQFYADTYGVSSMWSYAYSAILSTNAVIETLSEGSELLENEPTWGNSLLAEALALRAMCHFDLVRAHGKAYNTSTSDTDLGVTYKLNTKVDLPSRNTVAEVYSYIVEDLEKAKTLMDDSYNSSINYRLNSKAVAAILARVYLTMGNYEKAVENATLAITGTGSDIVELGAFSDMYHSSMNISEVLFRIAINSDDKVLAGSYWGQGSVSNYIPEYSVAHSLNDLYTDSDVRKEEIVQATTNSGLANVVWKWSNGGSTTAMVDIPLVRTSEMYLTRAEAYAKLNKEAEALADLNTLRSKRYTDHTDGNESGADLMEEILLQRRLELAFEGHRFYDLKRLGLPVQRDGMGYVIDQGSGTGTVPTVQYVAADSPYFVLPIPQTEIDANKNMVQNKY